jgi:predicted Zn-dependent peptidase
MPHFQSVSIGFLLNVGSRYEGDELAGASHFIEHMLFKGTARRPTALHIAEAIEGKGGVFNANTGLETTLYWAKVAAPHMGEAMDVLSDMLLCAAFDPAELEKERAVIVEEIKYAHDTPDSLVDILINQLQWPNHPVGRDIVGTRESVRRMSRSALLGYLAGHYRPGRAILCVAGRVTHAQAVRWAQEHLADWAAGPIVAPQPAPPEPSGGGMRVEVKQTEQTHLNVSFGGLSRHDPDRFALRLLNVVLGDGMMSRLFQEVRERLGLAYSVDSYVSELQDTGAVGVYSAVAPDKVEETLGAVVHQLDRLRQEPVPEDELRKASEFVRGRLALSLEDSFSVAAWYARQELYNRDVLPPEVVMGRYEAVRPADIQRLAQALFRPERLNLAVVGPFDGDCDRLRPLLTF